MFIKIIMYTYVQPRYNVIVGVHEMEPQYKWGALYVIFQPKVPPLKNTTKATKAKVLVAQSVHDL